MCCEINWQWIKRLPIKLLKLYKLYPNSLKWMGVWKDGEHFYYYCYYYFLSFHCNIVTPICETWHEFFINLWLRRINNLRTSELFLKKSAFCGRELYPFCGLRQHLRPLSLLMDVCKLNSQKVTIVQININFIGNAMTLKLPLTLLP